MTTPLSQEVRAGLVAVAAPVKTPYAYTILAYEATVVALTEERDAALERVKALEAARRDPDYEGHGGSPGEGLYERSGELEGQIKKRGLWPVPHQEGAVR